MAFRIPGRLLGNDIQTKIAKDLALVKHSYVGPSVDKTVRFYQVDPETKDIVLPLYYASALFGRTHINQRKKYTKVPPFDFLAELRGYQEEVVDMCIRSYNAHASAFLNVFCSFGKTVVTAYLASLFAKKHGLATLVTYPLCMVQTAWIGTFRDYTNAKVYIVGESSGPPDPDVQVYLCMQGRLASIAPIIRDRVGHFVVDEADTFCTETRAQVLLSIEPLFVTLLTATYTRDDGLHVMMDHVAGPERIVRISSKRFYVFKRWTHYTPDPDIGEYGIIYDDLVRKLDTIPERNAMIVDTVLDNISQKILVLTKHVEHAEALYSMIRDAIRPRRCALLVGKTKSYKDADVLIGTASKIGRGFDENKACLDWEGVRINMLVLTFSTKKIEQIAGRVFRAETPVIVDIVDRHPNLRKHWRQRRTWYESRNGEVVKVYGRFSYR